MAQDSLQCLAQLASMHGPVFPDESAQVSYLAHLVEGLLSMINGSVCHCAGKLNMQCFAVVTKAMTVILCVLVKVFLAMLVALWVVMSVCQLVGPPLCLRLKYLNNCLMDCQ